MSLTDYEQFAEEPLTLPIGGKIYVIPPISMRVGELFIDVLEGRNGTLADKPARDVWRLVLGKAFDEMWDDDCTPKAIELAANTALADFQYGREVASAMWESGGGDPERLAAHVAASAASKTSTGTASARSGRTASTTGTRSRTTSKQTSTRKATQSPGR